MTLFLFSNQMKVQIEDSDELTMFKELFPDMKSPESLYDKSPVSKIIRCYMANSWIKCFRKS